MPHYEWHLFSPFCNALHFYSGLSVLIGQLIFTTNINDNSAFCLLIQYLLKNFHIKPIFLIGCTKTCIKYMFGYLQWLLVMACNIPQVHLCWSGNYSLREAFRLHFYRFADLFCITTKAIKLRVGSKFRWTFSSLLTSPSHLHSKLPSSTIQNINYNATNAGNNIPSSQG